MEGDGGAEGGDEVEVVSRDQTLKDFLAVAPFLNYFFLLGTDVVQLCFSRQQ